MTAESLLAEHAALTARVQAHKRTIAHARRALQVDAARRAALTETLRGLGIRLVLDSPAGVGDIHGRTK
jgi:hypothetical protein